MKNELRSKKAKKKGKSEPTSETKDALTVEAGAKELSYDERVREYGSSEFTQRLLDHMNKAVKKALGKDKENAE